MKADTAYEQPREKLQRKGASSLTTAELLQVLIGSGNAQASVSRIAKRTAKLLSKSGSSITLKDLSEVTGLGPAHTAQIIASFELASRYPINAQQLIIDTEDKILGLLADVRSSKATKLAYVTVDGARRLIAKRVIAIDKNHPTALLRKVFADVMTDNAAGLIMSIGSIDKAMVPTMFDLSLARDIKTMSQLFMVTVHELLLVSQTEYSRLRSYG